MNSKLVELVARATCTFGNCPPPHSCCAGSLTAPKECERRARNVLTAILKDHAIVPRVPDDEMKVHGARAIRDTMDNAPNFAERARQCFVAMIEAWEKEDE